MIRKLHLLLFVACALLFSASELIHAQIYVSSSIDVLSGSQQVQGECETQAVDPAPNITEWPTAGDYYLFGVQCLILGPQGEVPACGYINVSPTIIC